MNQGQSNTVSYFLVISVDTLVYEIENYLPYVLWVYVKILCLLTTYNA